MNLENLKKGVKFNAQPLTEAINTQSYEIGFIALSANNRHKRSFLGDEFCLQVDTSGVKFSATTLYKDHITSFENAIATISDVKMENGDIKVKAKFYPEVPASLEAFNKFRAGLCDSVSVGFGEISKLEKVGEIDGVDILEIKDGEVVELSAVWAGADPNAKVAKFSKEQNEDNPTIAEQNDTKKQDAKEPQPTKQDAPKSDETKDEASKESKEQNAQMAQIIELGTKFNKEKEALSAIKDGLSLKEFSAILLEQKSEKIKEFNINKGERMPQDTSLADIILSAANPSYKPSSELTHGKNQGAFKLNQDFISQFSDNVIKSTDTQNAGLIATTYRGDLFIEQLRQESQLLGQVSWLSGLSEKIQIPRDNSTIEADWVEEGEFNDAQKLSTDYISLSPNSLYACIKITRTMLTMSQIDLQAYAFNAIKRAIRLKLEKEILYGTTKVKGLLSGQVSGINKTTGFMSAPTLRKVLAFEEALDALNHDTSNASFLLKGADIATLKATSREDGTERKLIEGKDFQGFNYAKNNLLKQGDVIFGDFKNILVGAWGSLEVRALQSQGGITLLEGFYDVGVNYTRANAFVIDQNA